MIYIGDTRTGERVWLSRGTRQQVEEAAQVGCSSPVVMALGVLAAWANHREADRDSIERLRRHVEAQMMLDHEDEEV